MWAIGGSTAGPNIIALCKRAGWSVGDVKDRYLKLRGLGQDKLLGRVLAMLNIMDESFAALPPHFTIDIDAGEDDEVRQHVIDAVKTVFPGLHSKCDGMIGVLQMCLASLVWHSKDDDSWLKKTLPDTHPLWLSPLFTEGLLAELKPHVQTGLFACKKSGMVATGLPPHCALMVRMAKLEKQIQSLIGEGADSLRMKLKEDLSALMNEFVADQGNISLASLKAVIDAAVQGLRDELVPALNPGEQAQPPPPAAAEEVKPTYNTHMWVDEKGRNLYHKLPVDHVLPKECNVGTGWRLWFRGKPGEHQFPYRSCEGSDFHVPPKPDADADEETIRVWKKARTQRKRFSKWRGTYGPLEKLIKDDADFYHHPTPSQSNAMLEKAMAKVDVLLPEPGMYERRFETLSQGTLYNGFTRKRKRDKQLAAAAEALVQAAGAQ